MNVPALFCGLDDAGLAKNAKMFGRVVLRNLEPGRKLAGGDRAREQFAHNPPPGFVPKRLERRFATFGLRFHLTPAYIKSCELKTSKCRRGRGDRTDSFYKRN